MRIGFIGAGKAGFTLGKYFMERNLCVSGYWSRTLQSSKNAAIFTNTRYYDSIEQLVNDSDTLFLTVPEGELVSLWAKLSQLPIKDKIICHTSGVLSSGIFSNIDQIGAFGYSVHPLFAIHSKENSYKEINKAFFTIEGSREKMNDVLSLIKFLGNNFAVISAEKKALYHLAAVTASNQVLALLNKAQSYLVSCGLKKEQAEYALNQLFINNAENAVNVGCVSALTGPVERGDFITVKKHLDLLDEHGKKIYALLSLGLIDLAREKHGEYSDNGIQNYLENALL